MPDLLKIGCTDGTMELLLKGTDYVCEIAKEVANPIEKAQQLHKLLAEYEVKEQNVGGQVDESAGYFRIPLDKVKLHFDLIDGKIWTKVSRAREFYLKYTTECLKENHVSSDDEFVKMLNDNKNSKRAERVNKKKVRVKHNDNATLDCFLDNYLFGMAKGAASQNMEIIDYMKKIILAREGKLDPAESLNIMASHIVSQNS